MSLTSKVKCCIGRSFWYFGYRVTKMFKELGEFITRRPWVIIAIWVIILIIMAPLAMNLADRLKYDATNFMPKDTDSAKAQEIYSQQFPQSSSTQTQLI